MEDEPSRMPINPELADQRLRFVNTIRSRRTSSDPALQDLISEVNTFPLAARNYLSFLTNIFLEKDIYEKIMHKPNSSERILVRLLNTGLSMQQAKSTLDYFAEKHTEQKADTQDQTTTPFSNS